MKKNVKRILMIVMSVVLMLSLGACGSDKKNSEENAENGKSTKEKRKDIEEYTWQDFVVEIDGNIIMLGDKMSDVEKMGFSTKDRANYLDNTLEHGFAISTVSFDYKDEASIRFGIYNPFEEERMCQDCILDEIRIYDDFYEKVEVILPGGIKVDENTTIDDIIKVWGEYTEQNSSGDYCWEDDRHVSVSISLHDDNTIFDIDFDNGGNIN